MPLRIVPARGYCPGKVRIENFTLIGLVPVAIEYIHAARWVKNGSAQVQKTGEVPANCSGVGISKS